MRHVYVGQMLNKVWLWFARLSLMNTVHRVLQITFTWSYSLLWLWKPRLNTWILCFHKWCGNCKWCFLMGGNVHCELKELRMIGLSVKIMNLEIECAVNKYCLLTSKAMRTVVSSAYWMLPVISLRCTKKEHQKQEVHWSLLPKQSVQAEVSISSS